MTPKNKCIVNLPTYHINCMKNVVQLLCLYDNEIGVYGSQKNIK